MIAVEGLRKLKENGAKFRIQSGGGRDEIIRLSCNVIETLVVGYHSRCFEGKDEVLGDLLGPRHERVLIRHAIESAVDLDSIEPLRIEVQHLLRGNIFRIELSLPLFVRKPACSNVELHRQSIMSIPLVFQDTEVSSDGGSRFPP